MFGISTAVAEAAANNATQTDMTSAGEALLVSDRVYATVFLVAVIVLYVFTVIADWKIFTKAGRKGWHSLIPVLNSYDEYGIGWEANYGAVYGLYVLFAALVNALVVPIPGGLAVLLAVFALLMLPLEIKHCVRLSRAFGKSGGFAVGLLLLPPVFRLILGFGKARYVGKKD